MWRGRTHGAWFAAAVVIAVTGVVVLAVRSGGADGGGAGGAGGNDAGSWAIAVGTAVAAGYCLFRASQRKQGPPSER